MKRIVATGIQDFAELRRNNYFYVDKTKFIKEWWNAGDSVTLITRPRRFGKTLMLDTVRTFFSPEFSEQSDLFEGLEIWKEDKYRKIQGKIPVIFLSFANIKGENFTEAIEQIKSHLISIYNDFHKLLYNDLLPTEKEQYESICISMTSAKAKESLLYLSKYLSRLCGIKPIILLDEYDTPLQEAWIHGYWDEIIGFIRGLFNSTFKTNPYMKRGLLTGITRISKESIFSDLNNLKVVGVTSNLYADCFGFTEQEVFDAMDEYGMTDKDKVKQWYDGFIFGNIKEIYNPWSIINYLSEQKLDYYWADTSSNALIGELIAHSENIKKDIEILLSGQPIRTNIDEQIVFSQLYRNDEAIWSLLLSTGYVKAIDFNFNTGIYKITLTNYESKFIIEQRISKWFSKVKGEKNGFQYALMNNNLDDMNAYMIDIIKETISYFDTGKNNAENFYHGFVLGLMISLKEKYDIRSNHESGYGRYDICMFPKDKGARGILIEFKIFRPNKEKDLTETCSRALQQIKEKDYIHDLLQHDVDINNIYAYGFAFHGKEVRICGGAINTIDWKDKSERFHD